MSNTKTVMCSTSKCVVDEAIQSVTEANSFLLLCYSQTTDADFVCQACWELASLATNQVAPERQVGHQNVCVGCGRSILRSRSRLVLRENSTDDEQQLAAIISQWIQHRQVTIFFVFIKIFPYYFCCYKY